jgi:hypothetical protein
MPIEPENQRLLTAAEGFLELGLPLDANNEIECMAFPASPVMTWKLSPSFHRSAFQRHASILWNGFDAACAGIGSRSARRRKQRERIGSVRKGKVELGDGA